MSKTAYFEEETQKCLIEGLNYVANAVKCTAGPAGHTVVIERNNRMPIITKDGITVAKNLSPKDKKLKLGADLAISISQKQMDTVGDGCQPLWEKIVTPTGYITFKDVKEGDIIIGSDGKSQLVLKVYDKGEKPLVKLMFTGNESVVCSPDHMWTLKNNITGKYENKKVEEFFYDNFFDENTNTYKWSLPPKPVVEFQSVPVKLNPFILGLCLANGKIDIDTTNNTVRIQFNTEYSENRDKLLKKLEEYYPKEDIFVNDSSVVIINDSAEKLFENLKELELSTENLNKFIPNTYLYNDVNIRKQLLEGLLFISNYENSHLFQYEFINSELLVNDVKTLVQSLGYSVHCDISSNCIRFSQNSTIDLLRIELLGYTEPVRCIKVSNEDELYLTSNFLVTHNTTTATILGQALVNAGYSQLKLAEGTINRTSLRKGIEIAKNYTIDALTKLSNEIKNVDELIEIATVSANGDKELGTIIAKAYEKVGKNGIVTVEESKERAISLLFKEGMTFDRGWLSPYFVTDEEKQVIEYENPRLLLCNSKLNSFPALVEVLQPIIKTGEPIILIAESFDSSVIQGLVTNRLRANIKIACIEAPGYGDNRLERLRDLAVYTGGVVANDPLGVKFESITFADLGSCEKIIISKNETIIRNGYGKEEELKARINKIEGEMNALPDGDVNTRELFNKRIAALTTGVAIIRVGGSSEEEIKELKDRVDDAQWACKAALEEGYLPGGGNTLLFLSNELRGLKVENPDEALGITIFAKALLAPFKTILTNAGVDPIPIMNKILEKNDVNYGYDARDLVLTDLLEKGILDPAKAVKDAIRASTSIAELILTSSVCITEDPIDPNELKYPDLPMM